MQVIRDATAILRFVDEYATWLLAKSMMSQRGESEWKGKSAKHVAFHLFTENAQDITRRAFASVQFDCVHLNAICGGPSSSACRGACSRRQHHSFRVLPKIK